MRFELEDFTYEVKFTRAGTTTYAILWKEVLHNTWDCTNIVGESHCNPKDRFEKGKGRKIALAKLLKRMNEVSAGDSIPEFNLTKEIRQTIWTEYFKHHKV